MNIALSRLISQQVTKTSIKNAPDLVTWFGAIQGQEYAQSKWSLGLRLPHLNDEDIELDFTAGRILRTHLLRPTWHFVTPEDIHWMLKLTAPRVNAANAFMYRKTELNDITFNKCNDIIIKELQGGKQLTRNAINQAFKQHKIEAEGHRLSYIMMHAELDGIICSGVRQGNQFTYALLEERISNHHKDEDREEMLARLALRYFTSRGPATIKDFSVWSGLTLSDCKKGVESVKSHLLCEVIENDSYYFSPKISFHQEQQNESIYLLPIYDEYIMGYKNRDAIFQFKNSLDLPSVNHFDCTIVYQGQVIGTWKRHLDSKNIHIEYEFYKNINKTQQIELQKSIQQLSKFSGLPIFNR